MQEGNYDIPASGKLTKLIVHIIPLGIVWFTQEIQLVVHKQPLNLRNNRIE